MLLTYKLIYFAIDGHLSPSMMLVSSVARYLFSIEYLLSF